MKFLLLTTCLLLTSIGALCSEKVTILYHDGTGTIEEYHILKAELEN